METTWHGGAQKVAGSALTLGPPWDATPRKGNGVQMCRIMAALVLSLTVRAAMALELKAVPTADGSGLAQATVESEDYRVKIIFSRGARIAEFTDLKLNVNGVAWRQTVGNGFLGDRHVFTEAEYQTKRPQVTPNRVTIPSKVRADDGVELTKTFVFEKGRPFVRVIYEVRNHGFKPYTLWVKNLGVPGGPVPHEFQHLRLARQGASQGDRPDDLRVRE